MAIFFVLLFFLQVSFDSQHCRRKCDSLFADSPAKRSLCLGTCSNGFVEREKLIILNKNEISTPNNNKKVSDCLKNCSSDKGDFRAWSKCRRLCFLPSSSSTSESALDKKSINSERKTFFEPEKCRAQCDRYWKGTVHWAPCIEQCDDFQRNYNNKVQAENQQRKEINPKPPDNNNIKGKDTLNADTAAGQKAEIFDIW